MRLRTSKMRLIDSRALLCKLEVSKNENNRLSKEKTMKTPRLLTKKSKSSDKEEVDKILNSLLSENRLDKKRGLIMKKKVLLSHLSQTQRVYTATQDNNKGQSLSKCKGLMSLLLQLNLEPINRTMIDRSTLKTQILTKSLNLRKNSKGDRLNLNLLIKNYTMNVLNILQF